MALASALGLAPGSSHAAPATSKADATGEGTVQASAESMITASVKEKPRPNFHKAESEHPGTPAIRGPKLPEAVRAHLKAQLDARVERDLGQIRSLRGEAIGLLTSFIKEAPRETPEMPEAMMRLGELLWENERESVVERFKEWEKKPVDQRGAAPDINYTVSRDLFNKVLRDYPWFQQYDLALYVDGFLATEQGKSDEAFERFTRILKEFPSSRFTADAHMARAENYFNRPDYATALAEYEEVLKFPDKPDLVGLALFKSAWCHWRLGNSDEATKRFVRVFEVTDTAGARGATVSQQRALDELQGEALKYLVEVFTEDEKNTAQDMYDFLTKIRGDRFAGKIVRALATTYFDQAHYERGIEAYELLLKLEPTAREGGEWILQIAQGYSWLEDYPHLKATYDRALASFTPGGAWARAQADPQNVATTTQRIEKQLREHAIYLNGKAQKDKTSVAEFEGAANLYDVYLSKFSKEPKAFQIEYYLAEIDFRRLNKNTEAATHYMNAAKAMPGEIDSTAPGDPLHRHDAVYNAIASLERVRVAELEARKGKGATETETDKKFAEALALFQQLYPEDPKIPDLLYRDGKLYYDYQVYDPAVKLWGILLEKYPRDPNAGKAGELIIDSFVKSKNYEITETWARKLKAHPAFQDRTHQSKLEELIVQAMFKQGEQKALTNDHAGATVAYLRAAKEYPKDPRAAQAAVSAETEARLAGDVTSLKEAAALVTGKDYRDKPESPLGAWSAATTLQAMGLFSDAADFDEAITANVDARVPVYAHYEHAKDAAYNAVILRVAVGDHEKAVADGNKFLSLYASAPEADEVVFQMGRADQDAGKNKDAADLYRRYLSRGTRNQDHRVQGFVLLAKALLKEGDMRGAEDALNSATRMGKQLKSQLGPDGKYAAAQARYMQGERVLTKFEAIKIEGDVKQLAKRLKEKAELLKQAASIFLDVVSFGVAEWTTAALYQVGHTFEGFGKALRDAPPPPEAKTEQEKEDAQAQIETFAVQFEEKALDAYDNGWKKAIDLGIYNQWTAKMRDALGRLNAEIYPPFKEIGFDVRSEGPTALPSLMDAPRRGLDSDKQSSTQTAGVTVVVKDTKKK